MQTTRLTITKSELREQLGCTTWKRFYQKFMTPEVITAKLGMTIEDYKRTREFNVEQSRRIYEYFQLN